MEIGKITKCTNFVYTSQSVKLGYAWASSLELKKKKKKKIIFLVTNANSLTDLT